MKYTFLGHACFKIDTGKERLLFDPFLTGNGQAAMKADKVRCDYILLSHAHSDHFGDANEIALRTGAKVVAIPEVIALFSKSLSWQKAVATRCFSSSSDTREICPETMAEA